MKVWSAHQLALTGPSDAGYTNVILQGHSLGCTKVIHYLATRSDPRVRSVVLLAPTDMQRWGTRTESMRSAAMRADEMVMAGNGDQLVGEKCWDDAPLSARVFHGYARPGGHSDIYSTKVATRLDVPMLVVYGTQDIGITEIDGDIDAWKRHAVDAFPNHARFSILEGASHGFREVLDELADAVRAFANASDGTAG